jgi:hypothetical protein
MREELNYDADHAFYVVKELLECQGVKPIKTTI